MHPLLDLQLSQAHSRASFHKISSGIGVHHIGASLLYTMELTFVNDLGHSFVVEIDPNMELENVMALLEAEVCCADPHVSLHAVY